MLAFGPLALDSNCQVIIAAEPELLVGADVAKVEITGRDRSVEHFFDTLKSCFTTYEWTHGIHVGVDPGTRIYRPDTC
jgi:hypothetical protein